MNRNFKKATLTMILATVAVATLMGFGRISRAKSSKQHKHSAQQNDIRALLLAVTKTASNKNEHIPEIKCFLIDEGSYEYLCDRRTGRIISKIGTGSKTTSTFGIVDGWANVFCFSVGYYSKKGPFYSRLSNTIYGQYDGRPGDSYLMHYVKGKWTFIDWFIGNDPATKGRLHEDGISYKLAKKLGILTADEAAFPGEAYPHSRRYYRND